MTKVLKMVREVNKRIILSRGDTMSEFYVIEVDGKFLKHYSLRNGLELTDDLKLASRHNSLSSAYDTRILVESNFKVKARTRKAIEKIELV